MHLSPSEVKSQLVPEALCPLGAFVYVTLFRIADDSTYMNELGTGRF